MTPDDVAGLVRALGLGALFQAAGGALFVGYFGERLGVAVRPVGSLVRAAAFGAILLIAAHGGLETARLSGEFAGACDRDLQKVFWTSRSGFVHILQIAAMVLVAVCATGRGRLQRILGVIGAITATAGFAGSGHTSIHPLRALLAPMLIIHVTVGACWFGSLGPLLLMMHRESSARATNTLTQFSSIAGYAVPTLGVVGLATAVLIIPGFAELVQPYGILLISKVALFVVLLLLASYNRWKYLPAMIAGSKTATNALRRSICWEIAIIAAVLAATSVMTTYFSPHT